MPEAFPLGFYNNVANQLTGLNDKLEQLNTNLEASSRASGRLATALNVLTGALGLIALAELIHRW